MKKLIFILSVCLMIVNLSAHCDGCGTKTEHTHGILKGNVKYQGGIPKPKPLRMDADPVCGSSHSERVFSESFIVDDNMNLKNALVWLKNVSYNGPVLSDPAVLDQNGCETFSNTITIPTKRNNYTIFFNYSFYFFFYITPKT